MHMSQQLTANDKRLHGPTCRNTQTWHYFPKHFDERNKKKREKNTHNKKNNNNKQTNNQEETNTQMLTQNTFIR